MCSQHHQCSQSSYQQIHHNHHHHHLVFVPVNLSLARSSDEEDGHGLLEEAIKDRSLNKYFNADPLWTAQLASSALAWIVLVSEVDVKKFER